MNNFLKYVYENIAKYSLSKVVKTICCCDVNFYTTNKYKKLKIGYDCKGNC